MENQEWKTISGKLGREKWKWKNTSGKQGVENQKWKNGINVVKFKTLFRYLGIRGKKMNRR